jgi:uncharacterized FlaG/YvyC family protein
MALGVWSGDQDLTDRSLTALKTRLAEEKDTREKAQAKNETLARAVDDLKKLVDQFMAQIPDLEENKTSGQHGPGRAYRTPRSGVECNTLVLL